ncbi:MAG: histidinol-phosphate transaminase [Candidatus Bathyarchaeia archaeon]
MVQVRSVGLLERSVVEEVLKAPRYELSRFSLDRENYSIMDDNSMPFPPSQKVWEAISKIELNRYPNLTSEAARKKISEYLSVKPENILIGNGSMELIDVIARTFIERGDEAIVLTPSYTPYVTRVALCGGKPIQVDRKKDFEWDLNEVKKAISPKTKLIFICNPNNPTGTIFEEEFIRAILEEGKITIIDEAYAEFCSEKLVNNYADLLERENVIVMRTLSKAFALAGIRFGYILANPEMIELLFAVKVPLSVNLIAQTAAVAALSDINYMKKNVNEIRRSREWLIKELQQVDGLMPYPSEANFIPIKILTKRINSVKLVRVLREKYRILVRGLEDFYGLNDSYFRITVGRMEQNEKCIAAIKEIMADCLGNPAS